VTVIVVFKTEPSVDFISLNVIVEGAVKETSLVTAFAPENREIEQPFIDEYEPFKVIVLISPDVVSVKPSIFCADKADCMSDKSVFNRENKL